MGYLVLSRKVGEAIRISDDIVVMVLKQKGLSVVIGLDAPDAVSIHREEVYQQSKEVVNEPQE